MVKTLRKTNKKGFTLVELVIVIAILAILAAIAIPTVNNVISTANKNVDIANAQTVELTLKTADAELASGTRTDISSSSKINAILTKYGVTNIDVTKNGKSGVKFKYVPTTGRVFIAGDPSIPSGDTLKDFDDNTALSDVIPH